MGDGRALADGYIEGDGFVLFEPWPMGKLLPEVAALFDLCECGADRGDHLDEAPHAHETNGCASFRGKR